MLSSWWIEETLLKSHSFQARNCFIRSTARHNIFIRCFHSMAQHIHMVIPQHGTAYLYGDSTAWHRIFIWWFRSMVQHIYMVIPQYGTAYLYGDSTAYSYGDSTAWPSIFVWWFHSMAQHIYMVIPQHGTAYSYGDSTAWPSIFVWWFHSMAQHIHMVIPQHGTYSTRTYMVIFWVDSQWRSHCQSHSEDPRAADSLLGMSAMAQDAVLVSFDLHPYPAGRTLQPLQGSHLEPQPVSIKA